MGCTSPAAALEVLERGLGELRARLQASLREEGPGDGRVYNRGGERKKLAPADSRLTSHRISSLT